MTSVTMLSDNIRTLVNCLYFQSHLPFDIRQDIFLRCKSIQRKALSKHNFEHFGRGTSKCARKRRAIQAGKCWKCGALMHFSKCRKLPTNSQSECADALRRDPVKLKAEGTLRPNSNVSIMIDDLLFLRLCKLAPNNSHDEGTSNT